MHGGSTAPLQKKLLLVFPTTWDERHFRCRESPPGGFEVELTTPFDHDCRWDFDVLGFIDEQVSCRRGTIDGVFSSSDYPGAAAAAAISRRLGLPGSPPASVLGSSHKYYSRVMQREAAPESTPDFHLIDPRLPRGGAGSLHFPCFIKPVKGAFSVMSRKLDDWEDLESFLAKPSAAEFLASYVHMFNRMVRGLTDFERDAGYFLAEDFLKGRQVTVEGFAAGDSVEILGIVDSVRHPRTKSFVRFDYPSSLSRRVQARMHEIARRVIERLGLENTLFNIEMTYDLRRDRIFIVEVNPRMCGQFADLYEKVDGTNGYDVACALAAGERPERKRGKGLYRVASSFPLRIFAPSRVIEAPCPEAIGAVERMFEKTLIWTECARGDVLSDFESLEDGKSFRYAVLNVGARNRDALCQRFEVITRALGYRFEPI
ncbi:MAG: ATP-grasp domain-containing protein [Vicinamibacteria bacterium]